MGGGCRLAVRQTVVVPAVAGMRIFFLIRRGRRRPLLHLGQISEMCFGSKAAYTQMSEAPSGRCVPLGTQVLGQSGRSCSMPATVKVAGPQLPCHQKEFSVFCGVEDSCGRSVPIQSGHFLQVPGRGVDYRQAKARVDPYAGMFCLLLVSNYDADLLTGKALPALPRR